MMLILIIIISVIKYNYHCVIGRRVCAHLLMVLSQLYYTQLVKNRHAVHAI